MGTASSENCFCCGKDNVDGLHLQFSYPVLGQAQTKLEIPRRFTGWHELTHGGFLSMLLDEVMAHAIFSHIAGPGAGQAKSFIDTPILTAEMTIKYKKPVKVGSTVLVIGEVESESGRVLRVKGRLFDVNEAAQETGVTAEASGVFIKARPSVNSN